MSGTPTFQISQSELDSLFTDMDTEFRSFVAAFRGKGAASYLLDKRMVAVGRALLDLSSEESIPLLASAVAHLLETEEWGTDDGC